MGMHQQLIIDTIHERRHGIDLLARPIEPGTLYADPDVTPEARGKAAAGGGHIPT